MNGQFQIIFSFFITGVFIGILFDIFRVIRKSFKTSNMLTYIEDIAFWVISALLLLFTTITFTMGEIRAYMIMSTILGTVIYFLSISKYFILVNSKALKFIKAIITFLLTPLKKIKKSQKISKK